MKMGRTFQKLEAVPRDPCHPRQIERMHTADKVCIWSRVRVRLSFVGLWKLYDTVNKGVENFCSNCFTYKFKELSFCHDIGSGS